MRRVRGDGVELAVRDEGAGAPVVLLHGFPDSSFLWRHQVEALVDAGFRTLAPDLRGFGESERPPAVEDYTLAKSVADVVAISTSSASSGCSSSAATGAPSSRGSSRRSRRSASPRERRAAARADRPPAGAQPSSRRRSGSGRAATTT